MAKKEIHKKPILQNTNFFATLSLTTLSIVVAIFTIKAFLKPDSPSEDKIETKPDSTLPAKIDTVFIDTNPNKHTIDPIPGSTDPAVNQPKVEPIAQPVNIYKELTDITLNGSVNLENSKSNGSVIFHLTEITPGQWKATGIFSGGVIGQMISFGSGTLKNNTERQSIKFSGTVTDGKTITVKCSTTLEINTKADIVEGRFEREAVPNRRFSIGQPDWGTLVLNITQKK